MSSQLNLNFIKDNVTASNITDVIDAAANAATPILFSNINIIDDSVINGPTCPCFLESPLIA